MGGGLERVAMKQSKLKEKQDLTVNQGELLFPDLKFLSPLCLKTLLLWKAEQLHDLALRMSELISALQKKGDISDDEEMHSFYSKMSRSIKNNYIDVPLAVCADFKIITMDELNTFVRKKRTDINITNLRKCFEFAQGVLRIKIKEPYLLVLLASACSIVSLLYRVVKEPLQEDMLKTFIAIEHRLTAKSCEAIGYWTKKLEGRKGSQKGGVKPKMTIPILMAIVKYLEGKPSRKENTNYHIANNFQKKVKENSQIIVSHSGCEWDVFFNEGKISAVPDTKHKAQQYREIAFSTFMNSYITEAKNIIKGESKYNQYIIVPNNI
jgi:polyhydroxyalkanoate synthesis regulator phasin